jgi:homoserine kinase type II
MLCLRRWPKEYPDSARLTFIHSVLAHVARRGFMRIPLPVRTIDNRSFVFDDEHLWELTNWLPGTADYLPDRRPKKMAAAMRALAEWHLAAADFPHAESSPVPSPGIEDRLLQMTRIYSGSLERMAAAIDVAESSGIASPELIEIARRLLVIYPRIAPRIRQKLLAVQQVRVSLQPCIRDVWHDHVLFDGDCVTGLIDFGALRIESVAGDVSRLLDSLAGDDLAAWQQGLAEYGRVRPLSAAELHLVDAFDESLTLLSGMNWLDWIFIRRRQFDDLTQIASRLKSVIDRLEVFMTYHAFRFHRSDLPSQRH